MANFTGVTAVRQAPRPSTTGPSKASLPKKTRKPVSQPVDADDLRRRLYMVISERNARYERHKLASEQAKKALGTTEEQPEVPAIDKTSTTLETAPSTGSPSDRDTSASSKETADTSTTNSLSLTRSRSPPHQSDSEASRQRGEQDPTKAVASVAAAKPSPKPSYHHVPQQAAAQFARTATAEGMADKHAVHCLSQQALKFHVDGLDAASRSELDASRTPARQKRALQRAREERERLHERNQFQQPAGPHHQHQHHRGVPSTGAASSLSSASNQLSIRRISMQLDDVFDSAGFVTRLGALGGGGAGVGGLGLTAEEQQPQRRRSPIDPAEAAQHRVDWSQSDERADVDGKRRVGGVLRKVDSLWVLKSRRSSLMPMKSSPDLAERAAMKSPKVTGFFSKFRWQSHTAAAA